MEFPKKYSLEDESKKMINKIRQKMSGKVLIYINLLLEK